MKAVTVTLYVLTALVTGLHNFLLLTVMVNGAPFNPLNFSALLGSATLLGAAKIAPLRPRVAAAVALTGSLLLRVYYAPMLVVSFSMPFTTRSEIRDSIRFHDYVLLVGMLLAPILLIACTANSALFWVRHRESRKVTENPT